MQLTIPMNRYVDPCTLKQFDQMESEALKPCPLWMQNNQTNDPTSGFKM